MLNKNQIIITTGANLRFQVAVRYTCFQIGCVIDEYDLFNITTFIHNLTYVLFGIILTQFYVNFSRQEHYGYRSMLEILRFQPIYSPFKEIFFLVLVLDFVLCNYKF